MVVAAPALAAPAVTAMLSFRRSTKAAADSLDDRCTTNS
jgi:hypothetical protein